MAVPGGGTNGTAVRTEMTYLALDNLEIVLLPGEAFPELIYGGYSIAENTAKNLPASINPKPFIEIAKNPNLLVFGLANDMLGYFIPPNDYYLHPRRPYLSCVRDRLDRNHYHETNSLGPNIAGKLAEIFEKMVADRDSM